MSVPCRRFGQKDLAGILDGFRRTKLDQTPSFDQVFAQVAPRIFTKNPPDAIEAIKFVQIAAKLNVTLGATAPVMFCCADGQWRQRSDNLIARSEIDLEYLLPEKWLHRHVISSQYEDGAQPAEIKNWRSWAVNPDKGGLSGFLLPAKHETKAWNLDRSLFQTRIRASPKVRVLAGITPTGIGTVKSGITGTGRFRIPPTRYGWMLAPRSFYLGPAFGITSLRTRSSSMDETTSIRWTLETCLQPGYMSCEGDLMFWMIGEIQGCRLSYFEERLIRLLYSTWNHLYRIDGTCPGTSVLWTG
jgi:hypothetical protein